jgi:hypothetical protein
MIYEISKEDKDYLQQVKSICLSDIEWLEKDLENLISNNIFLFILENQLMVISQEKSFQEQADILALDKDGTLFIFELKRWESTKENLLQVLRYGQIFGQYSYQKLEDLLRKYMKDASINLASKHYDYFKEKEQIENPLNNNEFNRNQHFVVITNGIDFGTLNAVRYWKEKGLKIDCLPFRVYQLHDKFFLDFDSFNPQNEVIITEYSDVYVVNTNWTWSDKNYKEMLEQEKAAAYGSRRHGIKKIKKGDEVFLYHSGVGIIAYGKASSSPNEVNEEIYVKVPFKWKVNPIEKPQSAISAWEINQELKAGYSFRQTVFSISKEMSDAIKKLKKNKDNKKNDSVHC